jgi:phosphate transport system permease protein
MTPGPAQEPRRGLRRFEFVIEWGLFLCALLSIGTTIGIIVVLTVETVAFLREVSIVEFLTGTEWTPLFAVPRFGVLPLVTGTILVSLIAMAVALPMGLLSAVYLSEYAGERLRRVVKPVLELLAGIPTVVYGYFALLFVTPLLQRFIPSLAGFNALGPGIVMGIMILPLVSSLSEDAMRGVPRGLREGSYALGATKMQTSLRVVVPAAFSGITAAFILAVSRAIGETMIVAIAAGGSGGAARRVSPLDPGQTITAAIASLATGTDQVRGASAAFPSLYFLGLLLFLITLTLNLLGDVFVRRTRQRY